MESQERILSDDPENVSVSKLPRELNYYPGGFTLERWYRVFRQTSGLSTLHIVEAEVATFRRAWFDWYRVKCQDKYEAKEPLFYVLVPYPIDYTSKRAQCFLIYKITNNRPISLR